MPTPQAITNTTTALPSHPVSVSVENSRRLTLPHEPHMRILYIYYVTKLIRQECTMMIIITVVVIVVAVVVVPE